VTPQQPPDEITLAVVAARLDDLREDVKGVRSDLAIHRAELVGRGEWLQRNQAVDDRFQAQGREIGQLRTDLNTKTTVLDGEIKAVDTKADQRRAPWWAVASLVVATVMAALYIVPLIAN